MPSPIPRILHTSVQNAKTGDTNNVEIPATLPTSRVESTFAANMTTPSKTNTDGQNSGNVSSSKKRSISEFGSEPSIPVPTSSSEKVISIRKTTAPARRITKVTPGPRRLFNGPLSPSEMMGSKDPRTQPKTPARRPILPPSVQQSTQHKVSSVPFDYFGDYKGPALSVSQRRNLFGRWRSPSPEQKPSSISQAESEPVPTPQQASASFPTRSPNPLGIVQPRIFKSFSGISLKPSTSTSNTAAGLFPPKTGVAAKWRDKIAEHVSNLPHGTKELNKYMAKREAARERKLAGEKCDTRIENARKLLAQYRAERDEEEAEEEAREEENRFRREEEERKKGKEKDEERKKGKEKEEERKQGKEKEEVPNQDHQTMEVAVTHSYVEESTEVDESEFNPYSDAEMSQDEYAQPSNWASASYAPSATPTAGLALSGGPKSPAIIDVISSDEEDEYPGSAEPTKENKGEPSDGEMDDNDDTDDTDDTDETNDTDFVSLYAEDGYPASIASSVRNEDEREPSGEERDEADDTDFTSSYYEDGYPASMTPTDDKVEQPSGGEMGKSEFQDLESSEDEDDRVGSVGIASPKGGDGREPSGRVADESTVGEFTLVTSLELALFGPDGVHREETEKELSNSGSEAMLPDTMTSTDSGDEGPSGEAMDETDVKEVTFTALDKSLFGPDVTSGGVEQDETETDLNGEDSDSMLPAGLTSSDDQVDEPSDGRVEEPLGEMADQSGAEEVLLLTTLEPALFGLGGADQVETEKVPSETDTKAMFPVSMTSTTDTDVGDPSGGEMDKTEVDDKETSAYEDEAELEPTSKVVDQTDNREVTFTAMDMSLFGPDITSGGVEQEEAKNESSGADAKAMLPEQLLAGSRLDDETDKASKEASMEMGLAEEPINPTVEPSVHDVPESRILRSRPATPLPTVGQGAERKATPDEDDEAEGAASPSTEKAQPIVEEGAEREAIPEEEDEVEGAASPTEKARSIAVEGAEREATPVKTGDEVIFTASDMHPFDLDVTSGDVEQEEIKESSEADTKAVLPVQLLTDFRPDDEEDDASKQVSLEMGLAEEFISPVVKPAENTAVGVPENHVLRPRSVTPLTTAGQGAKRKATPEEDDNEAEEVASPPTKKARSTAGQKAKREATPAEADNEAEGAASPPRKKARGGRPPRKTAAKTEPPAEPRNLRSRSTTPFVPMSLPVAAPAKRTTKRKATPVAEEDDAPEPKKAKGRPRKVAPAVGEEPAPAPEPKKTKGRPRKAAAAAPRAPSTEDEGRVLRGRSATPLATVATVLPPPPALHEARVLRGRSATPFVPPPPPPQPKPKRAAKNKAPKAEEEVDEEDEEAPSQEGKATKARKVAKPATRRSTRAK